eukprot:363761-Chlamydomonas_euryale.AAC.28
MRCWVRARAWRPRVRCKPAERCGRSREAAAPKLQPRSAGDQPGVGPWLGPFTTNFLCRLCYSSVTRDDGFADCTALSPPLPHPTSRTADGAVQLRQVARG